MIPDGLIPLGAALIGLTIAGLAFPSPKRDRAASTLAGAAARPLPGSISYTGNPYRIGAYVYVMETSAPTEHDWNGTFIGMSDGMALVRDETGIVAHVNRDQLYTAHR